MQKASTEKKAPKAKKVATAAPKQENKKPPEKK